MTLIDECIAQLLFHYLQPNLKAERVDIIYGDPIVSDKHYTQLIAATNKS